ncbi:MAG: DUF4368 domain-containing protein, partial [Lachnospiraceae bacterium]
MSNRQRHRKASASTVKPLTAILSTRRIAELSQEIDNATERSADVKRFVALVRKYTAITELTYENVHEFIDR